MLGGMAQFHSVSFFEKKKKKKEEVILTDLQSKLSHLYVSF